MGVVLRGVPADVVMEIGEGIKVVDHQRLLGLAKKVVRRMGGTTFGRT
jgi:hypothetical protein